MKEKSLIETAKMQGNVMVRWLFTVTHRMTPMKSSLRSSFEEVTRFRNPTRALAHEPMRCKTKRFRSVLFGSEPAELISDSSRPFFSHFHVSRSSPRSRTRITVKGVGKFGADHRSEFCCSLPLFPCEASEGRGNLLPKEDPINILLHLKLRGCRIYYPGCPYAGGCRQLYWMCVANVLWDSFQILKSSGMILVLSFFIWGILNLMISSPQSESVILFFSDQNQLCFRAA